MSHYMAQFSLYFITGRPPLVYGFNGIPFIVLIRTLYGKLLKRSPCARGHTYTDRRALTVFLYSEKMNRDSSDSNERESVRPQPKRRRRETIFCSHCDRLVPQFYCTIGSFTTQHPALESRLTASKQAGVDL